MRSVNSNQEGVLAGPLFASDDDEDAEGLIDGDEFGESGSEGDGSEDVGSDADDSSEPENDELPIEQQSRKLDKAKGVLTNAPALFTLLQSHQD